MILVLGGTTEGRELALELQRNGYPCLLSVATELGAKMIADRPLNIRIGELNINVLKELLQRESIKLIIDATHPYAVVIKDIARHAAEAAGIIYCRFERQPSVLPEDPRLVVAEDYSAVLEILQQDRSGILFTIGVKNLYQFRALWAEQERPVWVKIYPELQSLKTCQELGLGPEQIFAFHGAGTREILKDIIGMTGVLWLVTKESGSAGGFDVKVAAALETGINIVVVKRPPNNAQTVFYNIKEVLDFMEMNPQICRPMINLIES